MVWDFDVMQGNQGKFTKRHKACRLFAEMNFYSMLTCAMQQLYFLVSIIAGAEHWLGYTRACTTSAISTKLYYRLNTCKLPYNSKLSSFAATICIPPSSSHSSRPSIAAFISSGLATSFSPVNGSHSKPSFNHIQRK